MKKKTALIIGVGPAGLTAAYELLKRTDILPIVLEKSEYMGGISRTINYKGNHIDIGGHRFFSKSDRVMQWWQEILPIQKTAHATETITYQKKQSTLSLSDGINPDEHDCVMLLRKRTSRIFFNRRFFDYPLKLNPDTFKKLGFIRTFKIGTSYLKATLFPIKKEKNLEDFFINRFGRELYETFFKSYTEKVWGVPCTSISPEWGAQRIKGVSIAKSILHFVKQLLPHKKNDIAQKNIETSLIEQFLYPKYGPGQMWQEVAKRIVAQSGIIKTECYVEKLWVENNKITKISSRDTQTGTEELFSPDYVFSTMSVKELMQSLQTPIPPHVKTISDGLQYRDFITVGILTKSLQNHAAGKTLHDNWIYVQEPDVQVGRIQIFNNWSPYMVANPDTIWLGLEYFCYEADELWNKTDQDLINLAGVELEKLGLVAQKDIFDATVIRMEKTYPAYFGTYNQFSVVRNYLDAIDNLFLVGRNGMHKYNNQDHSMLTAIMAVDNIIAGITNKENIWNVNAEQEYHESKNS